MPYLSDDKKKAALERGYPRDEAELNFFLTRLLVGFVGRCYDYKKLNATVGAIESAKAEFQRRVVAPYEERKLRENGDVYCDVDESARPSDIPPTLIYDAVYDATFQRTHQGPIFKDEIYYDNEGDEVIHSTGHILDDGLWHYVRIGSGNMITGLRP